MKLVVCAVLMLVIISHCTAAVPRMMAAEKEHVMDGTVEGQDKSGSAKTPIKKADLGNHTGCAYPCH
ncbi:hypothetical protein ACP4OV_030438 [Aristida adscensionis]